MSYYEFPFEAFSYIEFLESLEINYREAGDNFREEYDDYLTTCELKQSATPIRFDISYKEYIEALHPASHLHIGHDNNIRIRSEKILGPFSFFCFLLRQLYKEKWAKFISELTPQQINRFVRGDLDEVPEEYLSEMDKCDLFLK